MEKIKSIQKIAFDIAKNSPDKRQGVGAVIFDENFDIVSLGNNSRPCRDKDYHICVGEDNKSVPQLVHAEEKALIKLSNATSPFLNYSLYSTHCPCLRCAGRILLASSIKKVYYSLDHDCNESIDYLTNHGIEVIKVDYNEAEISP